MKAFQHTIMSAAIALAPLGLAEIASAETDNRHGHHATHWGYEGVGAPEHWGSLKDEFQTCSTGMQQSPINITSADVKENARIKPSYSQAALDVINNGHTIQVNYQNDSEIEVAGKTYKLLQFHFHSPSEHTIDGKPADMVAHLVHKADDGQLGVIGVLMNKGKRNPVIDEIWDNLPQGEGAKQSKKFIDVADLLPKDLSYYNYSGSLTTPPCSEGVNWMVLKNPIEVSEDQVAKFTQIFSKSVRPVQPLHGRTITSH